MNGYFDHNATAPLRAEARAAWLESSARDWANPSSPTRAGARARAALESRRAVVAERLGVDPGRLVFTAGATEANHAVVAWWAREAPEGRARAALSAVEHPSVLAPARLWLAGRMEELPVDARGRVVWPGAESLAARGVGLVAVQAANNETGILQPWAEIAADCRRHGLRFLCDATQWLGRMPPEGLGAADFLTASAHKFGGPKGVGLLLRPEDRPDFVGQPGGGQENGHRGGTENVAGVAALCAAWSVAEDARRACPEPAAGRTAFLERLAEILPEAVVQGSPGPVLWNTVSLSLPRHAHTRWVSRLDHRGFQVSTGSACAAGREGPSHVLRAQGVDPRVAARTVRISAGWEHRPEDWRALAEALGEVSRELDADGPSSGAVIDP